MQNGYDGRAYILILNHRDALLPNRRRNDTFIYQSSPKIFQSKNHIRTNSGND